MQEKSGQKAKMRAAEGANRQTDGEIERKKGSTHTHTHQIKTRDNDEAKVIKLLWLITLEHCECDIYLA